MDTKEKAPEPIIFDVPASFKPIRKGQIRYCKLDGCEDSNNSKHIGKFRPCIIVQSNKYNGIEDATVGVIPLSHSPMYCSEGDTLYALRLSTGGLDEDPPISYIGLNRIMFIDRRRISTFICMAPKEVMMGVIEPYLAKRFGFATTTKKKKKSDKGGKKHVGKV